MPHYGSPIQEAAGKRYMGMVNNKESHQDEGMGEMGEVHMKLDRILEILEGSKEEPKEEEKIAV